MGLFDLVEHPKQDWHWALVKRLTSEVGAGYGTVFTSRVRHWLKAQGYSLDLDGSQQLQFPLYGLTFTVDQFWDWLFHEQVPLEPWWLGFHLNKDWGPMPGGPGFQLHQLVLHPDTYETPGSAARQQLAAWNLLPPNLVLPTLPGTPGPVPTPAVWLSSAVPTGGLFRVTSVMQDVVDLKVVASAPGAPTAGALYHHYQPKFLNEPAGYTAYPYAFTPPIIQHPENIVPLTAADIPATPVLTGADKVIKLTDAPILGPVGDMKFIDFSDAPMKFADFSFDTPTWADTPTWGKSAIASGGPTPGDPTVTVSLGQKMLR
jgi:hypothetical protein